MTLQSKKLAVAFTGSFCTYEKAFLALKELIAAGADVWTIFSDASQTIDSRFGNAHDFLEKANAITGHPPLLSIPEVEPIGPRDLFDLLIILPCTGNTLAKLANGITDTPVLMAAKAHLRNEKPLLLSISTNDALGFNMKNIGLLCNARQIYFVPFGQDNPLKKPHSLTADTQKIVAAAEYALAGKQLQPLLCPPLQTPC